MHSVTNAIGGVACRSLVSIFCCLILGFILYQWVLFNPHSPSFGIVLFGVVGSLFFFTLRVSRRNSFAVLLVLFVLHMGLIMKSLRFILLASHLTFFAAIAAALYIFFVAFYKKTVKLRNLHPLVLATLFAIAFTLATAIAGFIEVAFVKMSAGRVLSALEINVTNGFLIGLGIGLGILVIDKRYIHTAATALRRFSDTITESFREFGARL